MGSLMYDAGKAVAEAPARLDERQSIVAFIRKRSVGVDHFVQRGRLTAAQGSDLQRWLGALADDIDAQLHDDE